MSVVTLFDGYRVTQIEGGGTGRSSEATAVGSGRDGEGLEMQLLVGVGGRADWCAASRSSLAMVIGQPDGGSFARLLGCGPRAVDG